MPRLAICYWSPAPLLTKPLNTWSADGCAGRSAALFLFAQMKLYGTYQSPNCSSGAPSVPPRRTPPPPRLRGLHPRKPWSQGQTKHQGSSFETTHSISLDQQGAENFGNVKVFCIAKNRTLPRREGGREILLPPFPSSSPKKFRGPVPTVALRQARDFFFRTDWLWTKDRLPCVVGGGWWGSPLTRIGVGGGFGVP